jgi:hypothetical protein
MNNNNNKQPQHATGQGMQEQQQQQRQQEHAAGDMRIGEARVVLQSCWGVKRHCWFILDLFWKKSNEIR